MGKRKKKDEIEEIDLGKQPVVEKQPDGTFKGRLAEQVEYRASGPKAAKALRGLTRRAVERQREREAKLESMFGKERITDRHGQVHVRRTDEIQQLLADPLKGWGRHATRPTFTVPDLPWQRRRKIVAGRRERIRYVDGQRVVEVLNEGGEK